MRSPYTLRCFFAAACLCLATAPAQDETIPRGMMDVEGDTQDGLFTVDLGSGRQQTVYDASLFQGLPSPIPIQQLYFRANGGTSGALTIHTPVTVDLAYAAAGVDSTTLSSGGTWAQNKADGDNPEYIGDLTIQASNSGTPGLWNCMINLGQPFLYDHTTGTPLVLEISIPAFSLQQIFSFAPAADAVSGSGSGFRSATSNDSTSAGPMFTTDRAFVLGLDIPNWARWSTYGESCGATEAAAYQLVSPGSSGFSGQGLRYAPNAIGGYDVDVVSAAWHTPVGTNLGLPSEVPVTLPFAFPHPGGSAQQVVVTSSGRIWLDASSGAWQLPPSTAGSTSPGPAAIGVFDRLIAASAGTMYEDVLPSGDVVLSWVGTTHGLFFPQPQDVQCVLSADGTFELRWQTVPDPLVGQAYVGYVGGAGALNPGSRDLLASVPFSTQTDGRAPTLAPQQRPIMGTPLVMDMGEIPANAIYCAVVFSSQQQFIDLTSQGMPGCLQYTTIADVSGFFPSGSTGSAFLANIPTLAGWSGNRVYAQGVIWAPNKNPFGLITTHGVRLEVDLY